MQTALAGTGLAAAAGVVVAHSPYLDIQRVEGVLYAALIAAMTAVGCVALHRASSAGCGWSCSRWPSTRRRALDTLAAPGLDALGQVAWAAVLVVAVYILLSFPEGRLPDRVARGVVAVTARHRPRLGRPPGHRRAPARVHAGGELPRRMPAQPGPDRGGRRDRGRRAGGGLWSVTAGALIAVAVALTFRMRTAPAISRRTTSPILVAVLAVAGTFAAAAVARAGGAAPATLERLGWFSTATTLTIPSAFLAGMLGARVFAGGALERLVARLSAGALDLDARRVLADALGDPSLTVAFGARSAASTSTRAAIRCSRPRGHRADPRPSSARTATPWR